MYFRLILGVLIVSLAPVKGFGAEAVVCPLSVGDQAGNLFAKVNCTVVAAVPVPVVIAHDSVVSGVLAERLFQTNPGTTYKIAAALAHGSSATGDWYHESPATTHVDGNLYGTASVDVAE